MLVETYLKLRENLQHSLWKIRTSLRTLPEKITKSENITANSFLQDFVDNITRVKYLLNFELTMLEVFGNFRCTKTTVSGEEKKRLEENLRAFGQMKYKIFSSVCPKAVESFKNIIDSWPNELKIQGTNLFTNFILCASL